ncbi:glycosyl hydrolase [Gracilaria domingensis]|nr:glycosyl hydrolase [Gracilaria domingensis]
MTEAGPARLSKPGGAMNTQVRQAAYGALHAASKLAHQRPRVGEHVVVIHIGRLLAAVGHAANHSEPVPPLVIRVEVLVHRVLISRLLVGRVLAAQEEVARGRHGGGHVVARVGHVCLAFPAVLRLVQRQHEGVRQISAVETALLSGHAAGVEQRVDRLDVHHGAAADGDGQIGQRRPAIVVERELVEHIVHDGLRAVRERARHVGQAFPVGAVLRDVERVHFGRGLERGVGEIAARDEQVVVGRRETEHAARRLEHRERIRRVREPFGSEQLRQARGVGSVRAIHDASSATEGRATYVGGAFGGGAHKRKRREQQGEHGEATHDGGKAARAWWWWRWRRARAPSRAAGAAAH